MNNLNICPVEATLSMISDKWKVLIVRELMIKTCRFNELQRLLFGISQKVLTAHLRTMEANGLVHREVFAQVPPKVEYSLTPLGKSLEPVLDAMLQWGQQFILTQNK